MTRIVTVAKCIWIILPKVMYLPQGPFSLMTQDLTHWPLENSKATLNTYFRKSFYWLITWTVNAKLLSDESHRKPLMISQYWLSILVDIIASCRQEAITCANVDLAACHHMASLDHNELICQLELRNTSVSILMHMPDRFAVVTCTNFGLNPIIF